MCADQSADAPQYHPHYPAERLRPMSPADRPADGAPSPQQERHAFDPKHAPDICAECGQGPLWWGHGSDPKPFSLEWAIQYFDAAEKQGLRTPAHRCGSVVLSALRAVERERDAAHKFARRIIEASWDCDVNGGDVQDWALEAGLLVATEVTAPCAEGCTCAEWDDFPQTCYRLCRALSPGAATPHQEGR